MLGSGVHRENSKNDASQLWTPESLVNIEFSQDQIFASVSAFQMKAGNLQLQSVCKKQNKPALTF